MAQINNALDLKGCGDKSEFMVFVVNDITNDFVF